MQKISEVFNKFSKKGAAVGRAFSPAMFKLQQSDKTWRSAEFFVGDRGRAMALYRPTDISKEAMQQVLPSGEILFVYVPVSGHKTVEDVCGFLNEVVKPSLKENAGFDIDFTAENCFDIGNVAYKSTVYHFWAWSLEENEGKDLAAGDEQVSEAQYVTDKEEIERAWDAIFEVVENGEPDFAADEIEPDDYSDTINLKFKNVRWYEGFGGSDEEPAEASGFGDRLESIEDDVESDMTKLMDALDKYGFGIEWKRSDLKKALEASEENVREEIKQADFDASRFDPNSDDWSSGPHSPLTKTKNKWGGYDLAADCDVSIPVKVVKGKGQVKEAYNPDDYKTDDLFLAADEYEDRLSDADAKRYRDDCNKALKKIWDKYTPKDMPFESEEVEEVVEKLGEIVEKLGGEVPGPDDDKVAELKECCKALYTVVNSRPLTECVWEVECRPLTIQDVAYLVHCVLDPDSHNATFDESEEDDEENAGAYTTDPDLYEDQDEDEAEPDEIEKACEATIASILKSKPKKTAKIVEEENEDDTGDTEQDEDEDKGLDESVVKDWAYYSSHSREAY